MEMMFTIIGVLLVLLGLSLLSGAIILCLRKWTRIKKSAKAIGVVINNETSLGMSHNDFSSSRTTLYKPTVRFQTADGRTIDYTPQMSNNINNYGVGQNVPVFYNPQQPDEAIIGTGFRLWYMFFVVSFVGGVFALVGTFFIAINHSRLIFDLLLR